MVCPFGPITIGLGFAAKVLDSEFFSFNSVMTWYRNANAYRWFNSIFSLVILCPLYLHAEPLDLDFKSYYENGTLKEEYKVLDYTFDQYVAYFHYDESGKTVEEKYYNKGELYQKKYYCNGKKISEEYKKGGVIRRYERNENDRMDGITQYFFDNGQLEQEWEYKDGRRLSGKTYDKNGRLIKHILQDWIVWQPWDHHRETHRIDKKKENGLTTEVHYDVEGVRIKRIKYKGGFRFYSPLDAINKAFRMSTTGNQTQDSRKIGFRKVNALTEAYFYDETGRVRLHKTSKKKRGVETRFYYVLGSTIKTQDSYDPEKNSMYRIIWVNGKELGIVWPRYGRTLNYDADENTLIVFNNKFVGSGSDLVFHTEKKILTPS